MKTILLSGYYGYNNIGDEAVLGGILAGLRSALPEVNPIVLSGDPEETRRLHGVDAIPRMSPPALRAVLRKADLFISGGGSLLQDVTSVRSPLYYLGVLWLAQQAGVPTLALAQGMGPLTHPLNRMLARKILNRTRAITVRDAESAEFLRRLGVDTPPVAVTADPSFLLPPDASALVERWWAGHIPANRPVIGVALRPWQAGQAAERYTAIADALASLAQRTGALLLFLPMQYEVDLPISEEMAGWTPAESRVLNLSLTPGEMLSVVERCDLIVAMRLHTLIFAVQRGTPACGLAYDPKVRDFAAAAGLPIPTTWDEITTPSFTETLQRHWDERDTLRESLIEHAPHLTARARENIDRIVAMV